MTTSTNNGRARLIGWIMSGFIILVLLADASVSLFATHLLAPTMEAEGFPIGMAPALGIIIILCAVVYAIPRTAALGAILATGFFGGAICVHFRLGEIGNPAQIICLVLAVLTWGGLYLRDPRVRALIPMRDAA